MSDTSNLPQPAPKFEENKPPASQKDARLINKLLTHAVLMQACASTHLEVRHPIAEKITAREGWQLTTSVPFILTEALFGQVRPSWHTDESLARAKVAFPQLMEALESISKQIVRKRNIDPLTIDQSLIAPAVEQMEKAFCTDTETATQAVHDFFANARDHMLALNRDPLIDQALERNSARLLEEALAYLHRENQTPAAHLSDRAVLLQPASSAERITANFLQRLMKKSDAATVPRHRARTTREQDRKDWQDTVTDPGSRNTGGRE